jgi:ABC-type transporter Mla subunit MlaD
MNPKFEELRKRLLAPTPFVPTPKTIFSHSPQDSQAPAPEPQWTSFGQAMAKLFEPAQRCNQHLAEISKASDSIFQLVGSALERLEELEDFRDHMRKLSNSFASMHALQDDLNELAGSFEPVKALHQQVIELADAIRTHLAEVAASLEPANALRVQATALTQTLEASMELQAQFYELSRAFGIPIKANAESAKDDRGEMA